MRLQNGKHVLSGGKIIRQITSLLVGIILLATTAQTVLAATAPVSETITFSGDDGLLITADRYITDKTTTTPLILLFHQAGSSRGEYLEIAPRLNRMGFNCIAVDLRSGEYARGIDNQTSIRAGNMGLATHYSDALPDVIASLRYARSQYPHSKLIAWGSSYSAALVLKTAGDHPDLVDAIMAFSPGEYFAHLGQSKTWIQDSAKKIRQPVFITSSKDESDSWQNIYAAIPAEHKTGFIPTTAGRHGSRALWHKYKDSESYWQAVSRFFNSAGLLPTTPTAD